MPEELHLTTGQQPQPPKTNPLLARLRIPGETFRLPSGGIFYGPDVLDENVVDGEVHVYPMTTYEEILIKTPDLLFSGEAVRQIFHRCVPQVKNPDKMLARDVDFLLLCLRKVSYGDKIEVQYKHTCENAKSHSYEADITGIIRKSRRIEPNKFAKDFTVNLSNGQVAKLTPLLFGDYVSLMQNVGSENDSDPKKVAKSFFDSLLLVVKEVDEITDKDLISEWLAEAPPMILKQLVEKMDVTTQWGADFKVTIKCKDCGTEEQVDLPLNPLTFFT